MNELQYANMFHTVIEHRMRTAVPCHIYLQQPQCNDPHEATSCIHIEPTQYLAHTFQNTHSTDSYLQETAQVGPRLFQQYLLDFQITMALTVGQLLHH